MKGYLDFNWKSAGICIVTTVVSLYFQNFLPTFGQNLQQIETKISTKWGEIEGFVSTSRGGRKFVEFLGIPYAQSPVGDLRFEAPKPPISWTGLRQAQNYKDKCLQFDLFTDFIMGSEDCLYLNVYSPPKTDNETLLPVLVYIHGGIFTHGGVDMLRANYFLDHDVILVTLHYRLGAFGFLNTDDGLVRGNMGIKDVSMALTWVQENIRNFGGHEKKVTIMGHSAGAAIVHYLILSDNSKGLFSRAISMSGTALNHWALRRYPRKQAERFAEKFNCLENNSIDINCLKNVDSYNMAKSHSEIGSIFHNPLAVFGPTVELIKDSKSIITQTPQNLVQNLKIGNKVPWILGVNSKEGLIYVLGARFSPNGMQKLRQNFPQWGPRLLDYWENPHKDQITTKIIDFYLNGTFSPEFDEDFGDLFSLASFYQGTHESAKFHSKFQPTYLYYYSFESSFGIYQIFNYFTGILLKPLDWVFGLIYRYIWTVILHQKEEHFGANHGDETGLFFRIPFLSDFNSNSGPDFEFSKDMIEYWVHFAKFGSPPKIEGHFWPVVNPDAVDTDTLKYMKLDYKNCELITEPFSESLNFWTSQIKPD